MSTVKATDLLAITRPSGGDAGTYKVAVSDLPHAVPATETAQGVVELATAAETTTGTDNTRAVHPAGLKAALDAQKLWDRTGTVISPTVAGDDVTTTGDVNAADVVATGDAQATSLNSGPLAGFRNQLLNPYLEVHQRGTGLITTPAVAAKAHYTGADRWAVIPRRSNDVITSRVFLDGVPNAENAPCNNALYVTSSAATNSFDIGQFIELPESGLGPFQPGTQWTLTVLMRTTTAFDLGVSLILSSGSDLGSGASASPTNGVQTLTAGAWNTVSFNFTLPTDGTWAPGQPCLLVRLNVGADNTEREVWLGAAQLEPGPVATPFEHRPIGTELALCQRYYEQKNLYHTLSTPGGTVGSWSTSADIVTKRVSPTATRISDSVWGSDGPFTHVIPTINSVYLNTGGGTGSQFISAGGLYSFDAEF